MTLRQVTDPVNEEIRQIEAIYITSFPPGEREPFQPLLQSVRRGRHLLFLANEGAAIAGFAFLSRLSRVQCCYLEYLATAPGFRNRGIGARMLSYLRERLQQEGEARAILLEVDSPDLEGLTSEENDIRKRRIGFYARNGAALLDTNGAYCAPDLLDRSQRIAMEIMKIPLADGDGERVDARGAVLSLLTEAYGLEEEDMLAAEVMRGLP